MSTEQMALSAFEGASTTQTADDLQSLGARLVPGETTRYERVDRSHDRVVSDDTCPRCGRHWKGEGICPEHEAEGDLCDSPLRTIGGGGSR